MKRLALALAARPRTLVAYLCAGDPDEDGSVALLVAAARAGADVLEIGVPFSDPSADGEAIARASARALAAGGGLSRALAVAARVRREVETPLVLFGYFNPLFVQGEAEIARRAAEAGVSALLVVDLPLAEAGPLREALRARGLGFVPLVAPTSRPAHLEHVAREAAAHGDLPFVYYVSVTGVTGGAAAEDALREASRAAKHAREVTGLPVVVGFGIDGAARARLAAATSDGVVVGSALVRAVEEEPRPEARIARVEALVKELRAALG